MASIARRWLDRLRGGGEPPENRSDPGRPVAVAMVPHPQGPMAVAVLEQAAIRATLVDDFNVLGATSRHTRIMVLTADHDAAVRVLENAGFLGSPPHDFPSTAGES